MTTNTNTNTNTNTELAEAKQNGRVFYEKHAQLTEGCCLVGYDIRNWSGKRTLKKGKTTVLSSTGQDLELPSDLASPGRTSLFDTKTNLAFCGKFSTRMSRLFSRYGVKLLGNYLVPDEQLPLLMKEVQYNIDDYNVEVGLFCDKYESLVKEWIEQHPGFESVIYSGLLTVDEVKARFRLKVFKPVRFTPKVEEDLEDIVGEATAQLFEDVASAANDILKDSLTIKVGANKGHIKEECTQDIKRSLLRIRDKVFNLAMLDSVFGGVVDMFDELLDKALPSTGKIRGQYFTNLMSHIMLLTDSHKLRLHASGINQISATVTAVETQEDKVVEAPVTPEVVVELTEVQKLQKALEEAKQRELGNQQSQHQPSAEQGEAVVNKIADDVVQPTTQKQQREELPIVEVSQDVVFFF